MVRRVFGHPARHHGPRRARAYGPPHPLGRWRCLALTAVVLGDNCIDRYLPPVDREFVGGQAVNVAAGLAARGVATAYAGVVGSDEAGGRIVVELALRGVDLAAVAVADGATGVTVIESHGGERRFVSELYGVSAPYVPSSAAIEIAKSARLAYVAHLADVGAFAAALPATVRLAVDASDGPPDGLPLTAIGTLFASRPGLDPAQARDEAARLVALGVGEAVITMGSRGAVVVAAGGARATRPARATHVVDTLGAGDAFAAGFLAARLAGAELGEALDDGSEAAVAAMSHWGALPLR